MTMTIWSRALRLTLIALRVWYPLNIARGWQEAWFGKWLWMTHIVARWPLTTTSRDDSRPLLKPRGRQLRRSGNGYQHWHGQQWTPAWHLANLTYQCHPTTIVSSLWHERDILYLVFTPWFIVNTNNSSHELFLRTKTVTSSSSVFKAGGRDQYIFIG